MTAPDWSLAPGARLAVRMPNWLGDAMFALPVLRALAVASPLARLELHARPAVAEVLAAAREPRWQIVPAAAPGLRGVVVEARALSGAAAALLLPNSFASALAAFLARVPMRVGSARDGRSLLLTHPRPRTGAGTQVEAYFEVAGVAGERSGRAAELELEDDVREQARALSGPGPFAVLVPGAAHGGAKRWGAIRFGELGRRLREHGLPCLVLGSAGEVALARAVAEIAGGRSLAGETRGALFAGLLAGAALVVANDSGALHLALAVGTPAIGIYGPTLIERTGPITGRVETLRHPVPCSPCGRRECNQPRHLCMEAIEPGAVLAAALRLLTPLPRAAEGGGR